MASLFVETNKAFIEELLETQVWTKTQKEVWTTGLTFSNNEQRLEKKMSNLKATK